MKDCVWLYFKTLRRKLKMRHIAEYLWSVWKSVVKHYPECLIYLLYQPMTMFDSRSCDWLVLPLLLPTLTTKFSLDHKQQSRKWNRKKWKLSDFSDSDSVELMTPLTCMTPIFDFHQVISSLMTPAKTSTLIPSLAKTSLNLNICYSNTIIVVISLV